MYRCVEDTGIMYDDGVNVVGSERCCDGDINCDGPVGCVGHAVCDVIDGESDPIDLATTCLSICKGNASKHNKAQEMHDDIL